jgi:hypothetical protein
MVLVFLVPATGFFYNKHSCLQSGEVHLAINVVYDCCSTTDQQAGEHLPTCCPSGMATPMNASCDVDAGKESSSHGECSLTESSKTCCINEIRYIKSDEDYTQPDKTETPSVKMITLAALHTPYTKAPLNSVAVETRAHSPPFAPGSTDILLKHSVLLF